MGGKGEEGGKGMVGVKLRVGFRAVASVGFGLGLVWGKEDGDRVRIRVRGKSLVSEGG